MTRTEHAPPGRGSDAGRGAAKSTDGPPALARGVRGAAAGFIATLPMTAFMYAAERLGSGGRLGPEAITQQALDAARLRRSRRQEVAGITVAHLSFGTACGAGYALVGSRRRSAANPVLSGIAFGLAVWLLSYQGWVPAVGILPPAGRDRADRQLRLFCAHIVYGATLGWLTSRGSRRQER